MHLLRSPELKSKDMIKDLNKKLQKLSASSRAKKEPINIHILCLMLISVFCISDTYWTTL